MKKMTIIGWTEEEIKFALPGEDGEAMEFEGLTTFEMENGKLYILYTDNSVDENGNTRIYSGILHEKEMSIEDIESTEEQAIIADVVDKLVDLASTGKLDIEAMTGEFDI